MNPKIWGKSFWFMLFTVAFNYSNNPNNYEKMHYIQFYAHFQYILPCEICKTHYAEKLKQINTDDVFASKKSLINWLVQIHNEINQQNNQPTYTTEQVIQMYDLIYSNNKMAYNQYFCGNQTCSNTNDPIIISFSQTQLLVIIGIFIVITLLYLVFIKKK